MPEKKKRSPLVSVAIIAVVVLAAYFINVEVQTYLGEQALEETGLEIRSFEDALIASKETGKPVLADLSAIWCASCRSFDQAVLANEVVKAKIEKDYVFARLEYESDEGGAFMERYGVRGFPNILVINGDGSLDRKLLVTRSPQEFLAQL